MRYPKNDRIRTMMATAIVTALLVLPVQAAAKEHITPGCPDPEEGRAASLVFVECAHAGTGDDAYSCIHVDPWSVPPYVEIHWHHCLRKIVEPHDS